MYQFSTSCGVWNNSNFVKKNRVVLHHTEKFEERLFGGSVYKVLLSRQFGNESCIIIKTIRCFLRDGLDYFSSRQCLWSNALQLTIKEINAIHIKDMMKELDDVFLRGNQNVLIRCGFLLIAYTYICMTIFGHRTPK